MVRQSVLVRFLLLVVVVFALVSSSILGQETPVYEYAYVARDDIALYLQPSLDAEQFPNSTRAAAWHRSVGRTYIMGGAIVRVIRLDEEWNQVVPYTSEDAGPYNWATIFIRSEDLNFIDSSNFAPLNPPESYEGVVRTILVNLSGRTVTLMEGENAVFKTPVVANAKVPDYSIGFIDGTPRGMFTIGQTTVTRDMPHFPGVGWSALLVGNVGDVQIQNFGYWIHSSAWFDWNNYGVADLYANETGGCVSIPAWEVEIDGTLQRVDTYVFRWIGGQPNAESALQYRLSETLRIIVVDYEDDLWQYAPALRYLGINPEVYMENWTNLAPTAPDSFWANSQ